MGLEVLAALSLPGNPEKPNEDAFAHGDHAAVVMDGATSLNDPLLPGPSDAAWVSNFGCRRLMAHLRDGDPPHQALRAALEDTERSFTGLCRRPPAERYEYPFASMMFINESADGFDALWFGDCAALIQRPGEGAIVLGETFDKRKKEAEGAGRLARSLGIDPAARTNLPHFMDALRQARNRVNTAKGGWLFGPMAEAGEHVRMKRVHAPRGTIVLLASDGFLALATDYGLYDADSLVKGALSKGLDEMSVELRAVEEDDKAGRRFPRFKTSDDATALLLRVS